MIKPIHCRVTVIIVVSALLCTFASCVPEKENPAPGKSSGDAVQEAALTFMHIQDLDGDGVDEKILLTVCDYNKPSLSIGEASLDFTTYPEFAYDNPIFHISGVDNGTLIIIEPTTGFFLNAALYKDGVLSEVMLPFTFDNICENMISGEWLTDTVFRIKNCFDEKTETFSISLKTIELLTGSSLAEHEKKGTFSCRHANVYDILDKGVITISAELSFDDMYVFSVAHLTFIYDSESGSVQYSGAVYYPEEAIGVSWEQ